MYKHHKNSEICYACLSDVLNWDQIDPSRLEESFNSSRWFARGWTLQELLAPRCIEFYASDWSIIGRKQTRYEAPEHAYIDPRPLHPLLSRITVIKRSVFDNPITIRYSSTAQRMS